MACLVIECENLTTALAIYTQNNTNLIISGDSTYNIKLFNQHEGVKDSKARVFISVTIITSKGITPASRNSYWRSEGKNWVLSNKDCRVKGISYMISTWDDTALLAHMKTNDSSKWRLEIIVEKKHTPKYTMSIDNVGFKNLESKETPIVISQNDLIEIVDPRTAPNKEALKADLSLIELTMKVWSLLNDLSGMDLEVENVTSFVVHCLSSIISKIVIESPKIVPSASSSIDFDSLKYMLQGLEKFKSRVISGLSTPDVIEGVSVLKGMAKSISKDVMDRVSGSVKLATVDELLNDVLNLFMSISDRIDKLGEYLNTDASVAAVHLSMTNISDKVDLLPDLINYVVLELKSHLNFVVRDIDTTITTLDRNATSHHVDSMAVVNDISATVTNVKDELGTLQGYYDSLSLLTQDAHFEDWHVGFTPLLDVTSVINQNVKTLLSSAPTNTVDITDLTSPPRYKDIFRFLDINVNKPVGTSGSMPFSPAPASRVRSYQSSSGCYIVGCYGELLTYGSYLVTNGATTLSKLVPFTEVMLFEDVVIRIWYNASLQVDFPPTAKSAVFFGSFSETPILLSN